MKFETPDNTVMTKVEPLELKTSKINYGVSDKTVYFSSSNPGQNGPHSTDDDLRYNFVDEKFCILTKISQKFVPKCPIDNSPALVQIMACHRIGDKPLSEPMLTLFTDAYMQH